MFFWVDEGKDRQIIDKKDSHKLFSSKKSLYSAAWIANFVFL